MHSMCVRQYPNWRTAFGLLALIAAWHLAGRSAEGAPEPKPWKINEKSAYANADLDHDGIPDRLETELLARFTPMLRFSIDDGVEQYRPMDAWQYVKWSELQASGDEGKHILVHNTDLGQDPSKLLSVGTDLLKDPHLATDRFLSPLADVPKKGGNWARHGWDWGDVLSRRNVGLYGHVVTYRATSPQTDYLSCPGDNERLTAWASNVWRDYVLCTIDIDHSRPRSYYQIEYWQFFGYNGVGKPFDLGDHEGDWTTVHVIVDAETLNPVQVHHFAHGYRFGFDLQSRVYMRQNPAPGRPLSGQSYPQRIFIEGGQTVEYRGVNFGTDPQFTWWDTAPAHAQNDNSARMSQNNVVRLARDPTTGEYTHPIVYVEHGGHEFWPTERWGFQDSPNHNGDDVAHSYIAAAPPNLGEVEVPITQVPEAILVLHYSGRWGAYSKRNDPPPGPPLHNQWTWPASSTIRPQLGKLGN